MNHSLNAMQFFPTMVYSIEKPEFLDLTTEICEEYVDRIKNVYKKELNETFPAFMTEAFHEDPRMTEFTGFVNQSSWEILKEQGYNMDIFNTFTYSMWCQEHHKHSLMEQHVHGGGAQIVGFYFVKCPENACHLTLYDPRQAKVQISLPEKNIMEHTNGSAMATFKPTPGRMIFTNAWLPHSFTRNTTDEIVRFIHFNVSIKPIKIQKFEPAEII